MTPPTQSGSRTLLIADDEHDNATSTHAREGQRSRIERQSWGIQRSATRSRRLRLIWFYHACGSSTAIAPLLHRMRDDWDICVPEYPGRGVSTYVRDVPSITELARHFDAVLPLDDAAPPTVVFGHSMGALVAFEYLKTLSADRLRGFAGLVVSAVRAPSLFAAKRERWALSDHDILRELAALGRTPRQLLEDSDFSDLVLRTARVDYAALANYVHDPRQKPMALPIIAFCGRQDPLARIEDMQAWQHETSATLELRTFAGGHFYYQEQPQVFFDALESAIEGIVGYR